MELQAQGVVGHIGIGCVEHEVHAAFMSKAPSAAVLLTVNDYNLLRRSAPSKPSHVPPPCTAVGAGEGRAVSRATCAHPQATRWRRYGATASWAEAAALGVGVLNAGVFYMGLLADPHASWQMGFKVATVTAVTAVIVAIRGGHSRRRRWGVRGDDRRGVGPTPPPRPPPFLFKPSARHSIAGRPRATRATHPRQRHGRLVGG